MGFQRFSGPELLTASAATLHTVPTGSRDRIHQIRLVNNDEDNAVAVELAVSSAYAAEVLADGPVAYYRMNSSSGQPSDSSGNGNHTTATSGTPTYRQAGPIAGNTAVLLESEFFSAPDHTSLDLGDVVTMEAWVKRTSPLSGSEETIISKNNDDPTGTGAYWMGIGSGGHLVLSKSWIAIISTSTVAITDVTTWHHCVATKNGATIALYIDGVDVTGTPTNATLLNNSQPLYIGAERTPGSGAPVGILNANIAEVAVYPTALSAARVLAHYEAADPETVQTFFSDTLTAGQSRSVRGPFTLEAAEIVQGSMFPPALEVADDFNRANETPATGWTGLGTSPTVFRVVSNQAANPASTEPGPATLNSVSSVADVTVIATLGTDIVSGSSVLARLTNTGIFGTGYECLYGAEEGPQFYLRTLNGNSVHGVLDSLVADAPTLLTGDKLAIRCFGTSIEGWAYTGGSWRLLVEATDATYSSGLVGLYVGSTESLDDFAVSTAGELAVTATIVGIRESL